MKPSLLCLAAVLLAACGASGGLYLPDQAPKSHNPLKKEQSKTQEQQPAAAPDAPAAPAAETPPATPPQP